MIVVAQHGKGPSSNNLSTEKQLLIAAWAYGLKSGDTIHRWNLYSFIQSHLVNKSEENLQKSLETNSLNWKMEGKGLYTLKPNGFIELSAFGKPNMVIKIGSIYTFSTTIDKHIISITVDPVSPKYIPKINEIKSKPEPIIEIIQKNTSVRISTSQTSLPRKVLNCILQSENYSWVIN
jgi:hypothetical protein